MGFAEDRAAGVSGGGTVGFRREHAVQVNHSCDLLIVMRLLERPSNGKCRPGFRLRPDTDGAGYAVRLRRIYTMPVPRADSRWAARQTPEPPRECAGPDSSFLWQPPAARPWCRGDSGWRRRNALDSPPRR